MRTILALALGLSILMTTALAAVLVPSSDRATTSDWRDQQPVDLSLFEAVLDAASAAADQFLGS